ncbi:hypothetical protein F0562_015481 [Nyssa sinensis]|uniref:Uncharacterized protein n=1 Tax=Nyssa sinensis TaxID=561372 RepID=A0A5J4ZL65_9ASTE|nr:hypothetical protein F0562_015481 [Nyssa sinensis]
MASTQGDGASSNSMAATSSSQNQGSTSTRRGRGRAKNNKLRSYTELTGRKPTIVIPPDLTQPVGHNLHMFKAELGIICRCYAPIAAATWKEMEDFQNTTLHVRLESTSPGIRILIFSTKLFFPNQSQSQSQCNIIASRDWTV